MVDWRKIFYWIKLMNLYFVNVFQAKFSCSLYTLFTNYLNKLEQVWFDKLKSFFLNSPYRKCFRASVIFIFWNFLMGLSLNCKINFCWDKILLSDLHQYLLLVPQSLWFDSNPNTKPYKDKRSMSTPF